MGKSSVDSSGRWSPRRCEKLHINYSGKVNQTETSPISRYVLKGFLEEVGGQEVNQVNVTSLAQTLGLKIVETRQNTIGEFNDLVDMPRILGDEESSVAGTFVGSSGRIVRINDRYVRSAAGWRPAGLRE